MPSLPAQFANVTVVTKANNQVDLNLAGSWLGGVAPGSANIALWDSTVTGINTVVLGAGEIVDTAGGIADQLKRDAGRITGSVRDVARRPPAEKGGQ